MSGGAFYLLYAGAMRAYAVLRASEPTTGTAQLGQWLEDNRQHYSGLKAMIVKTHTPKSQLICNDELGDMHIPELDVELVTAQIVRSRVELGATISSGVQAAFDTLLCRPATYAPAPVRVHSD